MRYASQYVAVSIIVVWAVVLCGGRSEIATVHAAEAVSIEPVCLGMLTDVADDLVSPGALDRPDISSVWTPAVGITTRGVHLLYESADGDAMIVDGERWPPGSVIWDMSDLAVSDDGNHIAYASEHRTSLADANSVIRDGKSIDLPGDLAGFVGNIILSPHGEHLAYVMHVYGEGEDDWRGEVMVIDGRPGPRFSRISDPEFAACFSSDGSRFAYVGERGNLLEGTDRYVVVTDGKQSPEYDRVLFSGPLFSPDSRHLAYMAVSSGTVQVVLDGKVIYEYGGGDVESLYEICMTAPMAHMSMPMAFSSDSRHFAFFDMSPGRQAVVLDGKRGEVYDTVFSLGRWTLTWLPLLAAPAFHSAGHSVAFIGMRDGATWLVADGRLQREYELFRGEHSGAVTGGPFWTNDGEHLVALLTRFPEPASEPSPPEEEPQPGEVPSFPPHRDALVVDGQIRKEYDDILSGPFFGKGSTIVYSARKSDVQVVVVNEQESAAYDVVGREIDLSQRWAGPVISPDGEHVAFAAKRDGKWCVVVDGQEGPQFDNVIGRVHRWQPYDVPVVRYAWLQAIKMWAEVEGMADDCVAPEGGEPIWSPGSQMVAYAALSDDGWHLVAGEHHGEACDFIFPESIRWLQPGIVSYIAVRDGEFWRLTEDVR